MSEKEISTDVAKSVIEQCLALGIKEYVVCSGARNLPLISMVMQCEDAVIWSHFEERAAGFFALGRMMDSREPCAVITTSGTAVAEVLPAVIEAHYQGRPLVMISADRPKNFRGSGAPQAIEQVGLLGNYVEQCVDVDSAQESYFDGWSKRSPWQINVCLGEGIEDAALEVELGKWQPEREKLDVGGLVKFLDDTWRGFVVCLGGLEPEDREEVWHFLKAIKAPVLADTTSGLRELLGNLVISDESLLKSMKSGKVLRIGDVPVGRFWRDLEDLNDIEVLSVTRTGFSGLARNSEVIKGSIARIIKGIGEPHEIGDVLDVLRSNNRRKSQIDELLESYPDSEPGMTRLLSLYAGMGESLYLGNSLPIREWGMFATRDQAFEVVRANRGANGIDGQLATWAGWTHGIDDAWVLLGDLTALYDLSAPTLLSDCEAAGRVIVVMNNSGGRIFDRLPRVKSMPKPQQDIVANAHAFSFESWAMMWGWDYQRVDTADEIEIEAGEAPLLVELVPCEKQTAAFWTAYDTLK